MIPENLSHTCSRSSRCLCLASKGILSSTTGQGPIRRVIDPRTTRNSQGTSLPLCVLRHLSTPPSNPPSSLLLLCLLSRLRAFLPLRLKRKGKVCVPEMGRHKRQRLPAALFIGGSSLIFATFVFVAPAMPRLNPATLDFPPVLHAVQTTADAHGAGKDTPREFVAQHGKQMDEVPVRVGLPSIPARDEAGRAVSSGTGAHNLREEVTMVGVEANAQRACSYKLKLPSRGRRR